MDGRRPSFVLAYDAHRGEEIVGHALGHGLVELTPDCEELSVVGRDVADAGLERLEAAVERDVVALRVAVERVELTDDPPAADAAEVRRAEAVDEARHRARVELRVRVAEDEDVAARGLDGGVERDVLPAVLVEDDAANVVRADLLGADTLGRRVVRSVGREDDLQRAVAPLLRPDTTVADLTRLTGLSYSTLARHFRAACGLPPKRYLRRHRFRHVLDALPSRADLPPDWLDFVAHFGYHDQSHLIRDVRHFTGLTPTALHALATAPVVGEAAHGEHAPVTKIYKA